MESSAVEIGVENSAAEIGGENSAAETGVENSSVENLKSMLLVFSWYFPGIRVPARQVRWYPALLLAFSLPISK